MPPPYAVRVYTGNGWQDIAIQGATGPIGPQGPLGPQGIPGGTMNAAVFHGDGNGVAIPLTAAVWKTLPVVRAFYAEPAEEFVINADGSVTIVSAGWYSISTTVFFGGASTGAIYATIGGSPNVENPWAETDATSQGLLASTSTSAVKLPAGQKVFVTGYSGAAANGVVLRQFSIARIGGPQGQMEIYEQPNEPPAGAKIGSIWVDTDEAPPTSGNLPPGGTPGQVVTKLGDTDFAANWQSAQFALRRVMRMNGGVTTGQRFMIATFCYDNANWHYGGLPQFTITTDYYVGGVSRSILIFGYTMGAPRIELIERAGPHVVIPKLSAPRSAGISGMATAQEIDVYIDVGPYVGAGIDIDLGAYTYGWTDMTGRTFNNVGQYKMLGTTSTIADPGFATEMRGPIKQTYTLGTPAWDRGLDASATTLNEVAQVLVTLIADMQAAGLIKP